MLQQKINYPLTTIYIPVRLCCFAYKLFEHILGKEQYFPPESAHTPTNRMLGQFHAAKTSQMKDEILRQLCSIGSIVRVVFATVAIGMRADIPDIRQVIHIDPLNGYIILQQSIGKNQVGMQEDMCNFCLNNDTCLRKLLLQPLDHKQDIIVELLHNCCSVCEAQCKSSMCLNIYSRNCIYVIIQCLFKYSYFDQ